ncbi:MAG: DUF1292 domain-containing protein [Lachnospiraceae bacterium]|nr:DUF1292 domain-containing protein [Lachnospiraceae bacterium]
MDNNQNNYEKMSFETEEGTEELYILEQTMLAGVNYLLLTDDPYSDEACFIVLKEVPDEGDSDMATYDTVEDDEELKAIIKVFDELLEDFDLEV